jgi:hypothetical protein
MIWDIIFSAATAGTITNLHVLILIAAHGGGLVKSGASIAQCVACLESKNTGQSAVLTQLAPTLPKETERGVQDKICDEPRGL